VQINGGVDVAGDELDALAYGERAGWERDVFFPGQDAVILLHQREINNHRRRIQRIQRISYLWLIYALLLMFII